jgi:hypothetical protein
MNKDEALKMAIEALENIHNRLIATDRRGLRYDEAEALDACKEALEQPAKEPVAWMSKMGSFTAIAETKKQLPKGTEPIPLYTHPHQWQGLTDDEVDDFMFQSCDAENGYSITDLIRLVEQALKEKNHG